jgi:hypothetical protein
VKFSIGGGSTSAEILCTNFETCLPIFYASLCEFETRNLNISLILCYRTKCDPLFHITRCFKFRCKIQNGDIKGLSFSWKPIVSNVSFVLLFWKLSFVYFARYWIAGKYAWPWGRVWGSESGGNPLTLAPEVQNGPRCWFMALWRDNRRLFWSCDCAFWFRLKFELKSQSLLEPCLSVHFIELRWTSLNKVTVYYPN